MINPLFQEIIKKLLKNAFWKDFRFRKRDNTLINKNDLGFEMVELQSWDGFDLQRNKEALVVKPLYLKRFNILHKWFERYSFKSKTDQRDNYSIGFDNGQLIGKDQYHFLSDRSNFDLDFEIFEQEVMENAMTVFSKFEDVQDLYNYYIVPILKGNYKLPDVGADWVFEYLTITKIVDENEFEMVESVIKEHVDTMYDRGEPNIKAYYNKFDEIISFLKELK